MAVWLPVGLWLDLGLDLSLDFGLFRRGLRAQSRRGMAGDASRLDCGHGGFDGRKGGLVEFIYANC